MQRTDAFTAPVAGVDDTRHSAQEMDEIRQKNIAYEYMCHLEEAKMWLEAVLKEQLPPTTELEEGLQNGVYLAKLGNFMAPSLVPLDKIYDKEQKRYQVVGLQFRHTDNINYWLKSLGAAGLPLTFMPETTDVYNRKNMPRVIYCIHALSSHLFKIGRAPLIQDLYGKVEFTAEEIDAVSRELKLRGIQMPAFQKIGGILSNTVTEDTAALHVAIIAINQAIDHKENLIQSLLNPVAKLQHISPDLSEQYQHTLHGAKQAKAQAVLNKSLNDSYVADVYDELLTQSEIQGHITATNTLYVWDTALTKGTESLRQALTLLDLNNVSQKNMKLYTKIIKRIAEQSADVSNPTLKRRALQDAITRGNSSALEANKLSQAVAAVNSALSSNTWHMLLSALKNPVLGLGDHVTDFAAPLYYREMKADRDDSQRDLSLSDLSQSLTVLSAVSAVTRAADGGGPEDTWAALTEPNAHFTELDAALSLRYHRALTAWRRKKLAEGHECPLLTYADVQNCVELVNEKNLNNNKTIAWLKRVNIAIKTSDFGALLNSLNDPIGEMTGTVTASSCPAVMNHLQAIRNDKGSDLWLEDLKQAIHNAAEIKEPVKLEVGGLVPFQAKARGYLLRSRLSNFLQSVVIIQSWWRGVLQRKRFRRLRQRAGADRYKQHVTKITQIQALWRGHLARRAFRALIHSREPHAPAPTFAALRYLAPLLRECSGDRAKEAKLQNLKGQVVQSIRRNQQLSQQIDAMDIKIGLLVQNRIALLDVAAAGSNLAQLTKETHGSGLKSFTKESRDRLDAYQHLLYALQTQPQYVSQLLVLFPQSNTSKMLHNVILTLFSFGASHRDQYLLLRLLECTLREEIAIKFRAPTDAVSTNPVVLKMVVNFARQQNVLKQIIGPLVEQVIADQTLCMETNPVDIYKTWRNHQEMDTMTVSSMPYNVNQDQALGYAEVRTRFDKALQNLQEITLKFIRVITASAAQIPYSLRYVAGVLRDALAEKFPQTPDKDLLKIVGHLVYFSYINSAIVAPDAFDIITLPPDRTLGNIQRRNLASIAKILQFAATKKGFGEESRHLMCLNPFIVQCHEELKTFFAVVSSVPPLEEYYLINQYSDATLIERPLVYITLQELCDVHQLLLSYEYQIAVDPMDPLHELLEDLGSKPCVATLLGRSSDDPALPQLAKTEVCLALKNKFEVPEEDNSPVNKILLRTKELLIWCLPSLSGSNLREALLAPETAAQSELYKQALIRKQGNLSVPVSVAACKSELRSLLSRLELHGFASSTDNYQNVITAVARDICERGEYREARHREMQVLRCIKQRLDEKTSFYEEQVNYYNQYTNKCLENLNAGKKNVHTLRSSGKHPGKLKSKLTLRYTAARLHEKGVLSEVQGLPQSQLKNVQFEITPTEIHGVFSINGKFMGVVMEKVDLDIQNLLQLQFEGSTIMDMFGKVRINVNLLLALLNRKFYGKS